VEIAVIGWGSLIWCPGALQIKSKWHSDGPILPIEFARISRDGRLTLVILPGSPVVQTYWAMSELATLEAAQENLRIREGTAHQQIHATRSSKQVMEVNADPTTVIRSWLRTRPHLKAAIWTGLETNCTYLNLCMSKRWTRRAMLALANTSKMHRPRYRPEFGECCVPTVSKMRSSQRSCSKQKRVMILATPHGFAGCQGRSHDERP
jgi:hypothetical protein